MLNSGSSSLKYQLFEMRDRRVLASGVAERIGEAGSRLVQWQAEGERREVTVPGQPVPDHAAAVDRSMRS